MSIGSVSVDVVPNATDFWRRARAQMQSGEHDVDVRVNADTTKARAQIDSLGKSSSKAQFEAHALRDAIALVGPALVPIAAVASGALVGLVPVLTTLGLGVSGIVKDFKNGSLAATQYEGDIKSLQGEFSHLQQVAASGLLNGLDESMSSLRPLFAEVNRDTAIMSAQLGHIVGAVAPGLVRLFTDLNPLFVTFGNELEKGATHFQHWAGSSDAVSKFVAYVQNELPTVEHTLGQVIELAARLIAGFAPLGHVALSTIGVLAQTLNALPLDVLSKLETGAIAVYAAFRTYGAITAIVNTVSAAVAASAARQAAAAAVQSAALLQVQAVEAESVATFAASEAAKAAATAEASAEIAAALEGTGSVLAGEASAAAAAAIEFAAAMEAEAVAAAASAEEIAASAAAASEAVAASGAAAGIGLGAALGPIGAVAVGVGVLASVFLHSSDSQRQLTQDTNDYTTALLRSNGAITDSIRVTTSKKLADSGALDAANALGVKLPTLTAAVLGNADAQKQVTAALNAAGQAQIDSGKGTAYYSGQQKNSVANIAKVRDALGEQSAAFAKGAKAAREQAAAAKTAGNATGAYSIAAVASAHAIGVTKTAYLAAQTAAKQSVQQTRQQTAAWKLANDAGNLLAQTLDKLSGKKQSYAAANNAFEQSLVTMAQGLKDGSKSIAGLSEAAITNRGDLLNLVTGAQNTAEAYGQLTGSSEKARQRLVTLRRQIIDNAVAHGEDRKAVTDYINSVLKIPTHARTQIDATTKDAETKLRVLHDELATVVGNHVVSVTYVSHGNGPGSKDIGPTANAAGGYITGPGTGTSDSIAAFLSNGEYVINAKQTAKHRSLLAAINNGVQGFAGGGDVVSLDPSKSKSGSGSSGSSSATKTIYTISGSNTIYSSEKAALNAAHASLKTELNLIVKIDTTDFVSLRKAINGTVAQSKAAFRTIAKDAEKAGVGKAVIKQLDGIDARLNKTIANRDKVAAALGTPANTALTAYDKLANKQQHVLDLQQQMKDESKTIADAVKGSFNITSAGTGFDGNQPVTGNNILAQQKQAAARAKLFVKDLELVAKKLPGAYVQQLAEQGPDALPQVQALLSLNKQQLASLRASSASLSKSGADLGGFESGRLFNGKITDAQGDVTTARALIKELRTREKTYDDRATARERHLEAVLTRALHEVGERPVTVYIDGKKITRVVNDRNRAGTRR